MAETSVAKSDRQSRMGLIYSCLFCVEVTLGLFLLVHVQLCCVRFSLFSAILRDWLGRMCVKWTILCWVECYGQFYTYECCSQHHVEPSVHLRTWFSDRSPQCGSCSGAHTSSSVTVSAPTGTEMLCRDPGLCGSSSTRTMNSKESLADGWDPPLRHGWLPKLIASPLSTVCSCPQVANLTRCDVVMKVGEVGA